MVRCVGYIVNIINAKTFLAGSNPLALKILLRAFIASEIFLELLHSGSGEQYARVARQKRRRRRDLMPLSSKKF
jgi:hypothetical protein